MNSDTLVRPRTPFPKAPRQQGRLAQALAAMFAIGLTIASAARSGTAARAIGAAVEAIQDSMQGQFPSAAALLVLAGYAVAFALIARCLFRWE